MKIEMPTTIYDSSLLTKRRQDKVISGSFITRISPWMSSFVTTTQQPTTGYAPLLGIYDQSIINNVKNGNIKYYTKTEGACVAINNGCPCMPLSSTELNCCSTN
jgi:hypothetical protein